MLQDLRYACRTLRRAPVFAATAIGALALGIGANTAVFSVVYTVLLKPLPYAEPDRLVRVSENGPDGADTGVVSSGTFVDWRARTHSVESVAAYTDATAGETLWGFGDRFHAVRTSRVSPAVFDVLRVAPILGRTFRREQDEAAAAGERGKLVISYAIWQRLFGGAADIVGRTVSVEGRFPAEIIGVMPRGFAFPEGAEAWASLAVVGVPVDQRRRQSFHVIARLRSGLTLDAARAEFNRVSAQLAAEQPASNAGWTARVVSQAGSDTGAAKAALLALLGAVIGVLLIGCASVANLLLARAAARGQELAVRIALGARLSDLVRHHLADAMAVSACATVAGIAVGQILTRVLVRLAPVEVPRLAEAAVNTPVMIFTGAAGFATALLIGIAPVLHGARADRVALFTHDARLATASNANVRRWLIGAEVAIVVLLMTGALLLVRTFVKLRGIDPGFRTDRVLEVSTRWPIGRLFPPPAAGALNPTAALAPLRPWPRIQRGVDDLIAAVGSVAGVEAVGLVSQVPLTGDLFSGTVWRVDAPAASGSTPPSDLRGRWTADIDIVTAGYFRAMGIAIVRGRNFAETDRLTDEQLSDPTAPRPGVVIVNEAFANRYFPRQDPVGHSLFLYDDQEFGAVRAIVGVAADIRSRAIAEAPRPAVFIPHAQHPDVFVPSLVVRSSLPVDAIAAPIRERIESADPQLLVQRIRPMDDVVSGALARPRFNLLLLGSFALVALVLSAVGIYGVVSLVVSQRTREIGIRIALGAGTRQVARLVVTEGMAPVALGGLGGMLAAVLATRAMRTMLFGVSPLDPVSFLAAPTVLAAVALLACYVPARRATRVDPIVALRAE